MDVRFCERRNHRREAHMRAVNSGVEFLRAPQRRASGELRFLLTIDSVENHTTTRATSLIGVIWTAYPRRCSWRTNARLRF